MNFIPIADGERETGEIDLFAFVPAVEKARERAGGLDLFQLLDQAGAVSGREGASAGAPEATDAADGSTKSAIKEHIKNAGSRLGTEAGSRLASLLG
jgi:hypothetical protein